MFRTAIDGLVRQGFRPGCRQVKLNVSALVVGALGSRRRERIPQKFWMCSTCFLSLRVSGSGRRSNVGVVASGYRLRVPSDDHRVECVRVNCT